MSKVFLVLALFLTTLASVGAQPLDLRVTPQAAQSPAAIRVTVMVEPDPANRELTIKAECSSFLRSSSFSLEGDDAPRTHTRTFSGLPAGTYEVSARVVRSDGTDDVIATTVVVSGQPR